MPSKPTKPTTDLEPIVVAPREARRLLGVSNSHLYHLLKSGELESFHSRRARRIPVAAIHKYIARQLAAATGKRPRGRPRKAAAATEQAGVEA
jgi:excisionase family DNA binding protein